MPLSYLWPSKQNYPRVSGALILWQREQGFYRVTYPMRGGLKDAPLFTRGDIYAHRLIEILSIR